jgi:hypothetical protein
MPLMPLGEMFLTATIMVVTVLAEIAFFVLIGMI